MCVSQILNPKTCLHKILQEEYIILLAEQEAEVSVTLKELAYYYYLEREKSFVTGEI